MNFEFTDEKINTIYSALVEQPYKTAQPVLQSIQKQYNTTQRKNSRNEKPMLVHLPKKCNYPCCKALLK